MTVPESRALAVGAILVYQKTWQSGSYLHGRSGIGKVIEVNEQGVKVCFYHVWNATEEGDAYFDHDAMADFGVYRPMA